jgi:hypothetical protein
LTGEPGSVDRVLSQLVEGRLVIVGTDSSAIAGPSDQQTVEIVHEALLSNWERYAGWIDQEMGSLRVESDVRGAADQWRGSAKDASYLLTGSRLRGAQRWAEEHRSIVTPDLSEFLDASASEFDTITRLRAGTAPSTGMGWRLLADAEEWFAAGSDPEFLYRAPKLKRAREWTGAHPDQTSSLIRDFLTAGENYSSAPPSPTPESESLLRDIQAALKVQVDAVLAAPEVNGFSFGRYSKPARYVSGDLAGLRERHDGRFAFWLADCSGKGLPAALYAALLQGLFLASFERHPENVMKSINSMLLSQRTSNMYATCVYGVLDPHTNTVWCANAGATTPIIATADIAKKDQGRRCAVRFTARQGI